VAHGESGSVLATTVEEALPDLRCLISTYNPNDVFNVDETGLFFKMQASRFLATKQLEGKKVDKQRLTVVACVNASGSEKLPLWVIGKYAKPRCFKNIDIRSLGCEYRANKKAWMTARLFNDWMQWFARHMTGRQVLLLMDNCPAHTAAFLDFGNVKVRFLPPNTTAKLQPLDSGVIRALKAHYRRQQALRTLALAQDNANNQDVSQPSMSLQPTLKQYKPDVLDAINMLVSAWEVDVSATTIANCWRHCRLSCDTEHTESEIEAVVIELGAILERINYQDTIPAQELINFNGEQEVCESQTEADFFASLDAPAEAEEEEDNTMERPRYTSKQAQDALEVLLGYAMQNNDESGQGRKAVAAYDRFLSAKLMQSKRQTELTDFFIRQESSL
jgi:hypothetical protein